MRELSQHEASMVSAGEMTCAVGAQSVPCPGSTDYSHGVEWLTSALTDLMEKLANWWNS
jgi:hypothetical protein